MLFDNIAKNPCGDNNQNSFVNNVEPRYGYLVTVNWDDGTVDGYGSYIMGFFDSKEKAAQYIYEVTGMHVNDDNDVRIFEETTINYRNNKKVTKYADMAIKKFAFNTYDFKPDWSNVESIDEIIS